MIVFPNCKINLGLYILGKRTDAYHNLETAFYPLPFCDVLEVIQSSNSKQQYELFLSGNKIEDEHENNLCIKAYHLLKKDFPQLPSIKIYLHKVIPSGAGLGGGSADGAFMLMLLNDKFHLQLSQQQLLNYALLLGSDCPFFIINKPCFAQQRGEILEPVQVSLSAYKLMLINPGIHVNTAWAFTQIQFSNPNNIKAVITKPVEEWKNNLTNDFELPVFTKYPEIKNIKDHLYSLGALYASMSGSGSTVFGIFEKNSIINQKNFPSHYFVKEFA
ncbi:MAG TPA: 4-(cytidine 5'-diphospho)-2-C-methyl-D-erythritol kinase [Parafilimonas sp.]